MTPELRLVALAMLMVASVPAIIIIAYLIIGRRERRALAVQVTEIHAMVNDAMTHEKGERLVSLKAQLLLLRRQGDDEFTPDDRVLIKKLEMQAVTLEQEIEGRDKLADELAAANNPQTGGD